MLAEHYVFKIRCTPLTSLLLQHYQITPGVFELIKQAKEGTFPSGNYFGQVKLAPFHDFEAQIPADVKTRLTEIDAGLKDGSIEIGYEPFN
jgi:basic membrane protein A